MQLSSNDKYLYSFYIIYHIEINMVREIDFTRQLSEDDGMRVVIKTDKSEVKRFQVIQISVIDGTSYQILRYDCAHGVPHKDKLYTHPPKKEDMSELPMKTLYELAKNDIEQNYKKYRQEYIRNILKKTST
jgi:hypothetical protein